MGKLRENHLHRGIEKSIPIGIACAICALACALTACNMPGQDGTVNFAGNTNQTTPPLSGPGQTGGSGSEPSPLPVPTSTITSPPVSGENVIGFQIGGSGVCGQEGSVNQPCASVTVCAPGTSSCQTISDLLVDTGSYGLRIFSSALSVSLTQLQDTSKRSLAECAQFGTGADWGPVMQADVQLAGETKVAMPIQVINSTYAGGPPQAAVNYGCTDIDTSPDEAGYNGILGIGLFTQDCGTDCEASSSYGLYYGCNGNTCSGATVSLANQVVNPIAMLLADNNGLVFNLPSLGTDPTLGSAGVAGTVYLGVGTQENNTPGSVKTYQSDSYGDLSTQFNGESYPDSFIDSGSNGLFFPPPSSLPACGSNTDAPGWFCPTSSTEFTASNASATGGTAVPLTFWIANAVTLVDTGNVAFDDLGASSLSSGFSDSFDWGLPFFFGRTVYIGIDGTSSSLGTGPYWAY